MNNYDDVLLRNVIVGISSYFWKRIHITITKNNDTQQVNVPFFYSMTGEEQFLTDFFVSTDKNYNNLRIDGNVDKVPRGIFHISNGGRSSDEMTQRYIRSVHMESKENEYGNQINAKSSVVDHIPISLDFGSKVICSSDIQRLKIFESLIKALYNTDVVYIRYNGFNSIPVMIGFPDDFDISKDFVFQYPDNGSNKPQLEFSFSILTYLPNIDHSSTFNVSNKMSNIKINNKKAE